MSLTSSLAAAYMKGAGDINGTVTDSQLSDTHYPVGHRHTYRIRQKSVHRPAGAGTYWEVHIQDKLAEPVHLIWGIRPVPVKDALEDGSL